MVHTMPSTGCFIRLGDFVKGHRSKHNDRNITPIAVT